MQSQWWTFISSFEAAVCLIPEFRNSEIQLWAAAASSAGEAERSLSSLFCAARLPSAGEEGDWGSCCWESWERRTSTLWTRTESRTFCSSEENRPRTWRSTDVFPAGRPIPTRSLGITCRRGQEVILLVHTHIHRSHLSVFFCFRFFNYSKRLNRKFSPICVPLEKVLSYLTNNQC